MGKTNPDQLSNEERELITYFVNTAQAFGLPKSIGEIYGLFFASEEPLSLDTVVERLQISKGSASQGIRFLRSINALNLTYLPGNRRDHFSPELSLRRIAEGYLSERILPQLKDGTDRLKHIDASRYSNLYIQRTKAITSWYKRANAIFPVVKKLLGK